MRALFSHLVSPIPYDVRAIRGILFRAATPRRPLAILLFRFVVASLSRLNGRNAIARIKMRRATQREMSFRTLHVGALLIDLIAN